jgi:serine/threonine protein kinase
MMLATGTRIGPYEIQSPLGVGGMGEVYRARDTKLGRVARFQREAQVLASLNHPHIAQIYRFEDGPPEGGPYVPEGVGAGFSRPLRALVMELVDDPTLADRIAHGPIPLDEALPIARQDGRSARGSARAGHYPSRPEAGKRHGPAGRHGQGAGLRSGEADRAG